MSSVVTRRSSRRCVVSSKGRARCMVARLSQITRSPDRPAMPVDELGLRRVLDQVAQEEPALRERPVDDLRGVGRQVERPAARARDDPDERVDGALEATRLLPGELEAERLARVGDRVMDAQALETGLHVRRQRVVGGAHVRVLRVGADRRDDLRGEHRVAARRILEGRVGVPETVPEPVRPAPVVGRRDLAALVEVRDVDEGVVGEAVEPQGAPSRSSRAAGRRAAGRRRAAPRR